jgi:hypothetical protein
MTTEQTTRSTAAAHTPGPWRITGSGDKGEMVYGPDGRTVAVWPYEGFNPPDSLEAMANARLIASAPALLAALEAAVERMEAVAEGIPVHNRHSGVSQATHVAHMAGHLAQHAKIARAAIAQARGEG